MRTPETSPVYDLNVEYRRRNSERRAHSRDLYVNSQPIAELPYNDSSAEPEFRLRRLHDLCNEGFSYWGTEVPRGDRVVLATETSGGYVELLAEVCHISEVTCMSTPLYLVGCRVLGTRDV
jgi:hypothetical protein